MRSNRFFVKIASIREHCQLHILCDMRRQKIQSEQVITSYLNAVRVKLIMKSRGIVYEREIWPGISCASPERSSRHGWFVSLRKRRPLKARPSTS